MVIGADGDAEVVGERGGVPEAGDDGLGAEGLEDVGGGAGTGLLRNTSQ